ncbi:MAG TPA: hypothetical protein VKV35_02885 [Streptosporangiaceae bacterium]|nr:hypothetical protein [Streptosporangiaceae bacterium]
MTNSPATRSMLATTRRPSASIGGIAANVPSSSTTRATERLAWLPEPIAMPRSACLSACTSLTPSPAIATTWPAACSARTAASFCAGRTRPRTFVDASAPPTSSSPSAEASRGGPPAGIPARRAIAAAARGASPDSTLIVMPWPSRYRTDAAASSRSSSASTSSAAGSAPAGGRSLPSGPGVLASMSTRRPASSWRRTDAATSAGMVPAMTDGAPSSQVPRPSNVAPVHLRADENGTRRRTVHPSGAG